MAKEATFLIARAAEEFIIRMSQETYQVAAREKRTILQERDISELFQSVCRTCLRIRSAGTVVRKNEEYWYLRGTHVQANSLVALPTINQNYWVI